LSIRENAPIEPPDGTNPIPLEEVGPALATTNGFSVTVKTYRSSPELQAEYRQGEWSAHVEFRGFWHPVERLRPGTQYLEGWAQVRVEGERETVRLSDEAVLTFLRVADDGLPLTDKQRGYAQQLASVLEGDAQRMAEEKQNFHRKEAAEAGRALAELMKDTTGLEPLQRPDDGDGRFYYYWRFHGWLIDAGKSGPDEEDATAADLYHVNLMHPEARAHVSRTFNASMSPTVRFWAWIASGRGKLPDWDPLDI
jgi:hypothetical protein